MFTWAIHILTNLATFVQANFGALLVDLLLTALLAHPLITFIQHGWQQKAEEIGTSLSVSAKQSYLKAFQQLDVPQAQAPARYDEFYRKWYGRRYYVLPIILVVLVALVENFVLAQTLLKLDAQSAKLNVMAASIAGAYTFVTWNFFTRVQRMNMSIADVMRGALRLAIAIPLGFTLGGLASDAGPFLAFAIGVFPLETIRTILRQLANKKLGLEMGPSEAKSQVSKLSGVDAGIAARIEDADVTTIAQLAWCDPIQLTMRTNLRFGFVTDIVGQALAWVYLEAKLETLRPFGLRGAFEIHEFLVNDLGSSHKAQKDSAKKVLAAAAAAVGITADALRYTFEQIANDTATEFLYEAG